MGACMSEQQIKYDTESDAVRPKAQIRQTSHKLVVKNSYEPEQIQIPRKGSKKNCVLHDKVDTKVHEHALARRRDYMEPWLCGGAQEQDGCQSGNAAFQPGFCTKTWICQDCAFFLCKPCIKHYAKNYQSQEKQRNDPQDRANMNQNIESNWDRGEDDF